MLQWKKITDFERYSVSNSGVVRNDERGKELKPMHNSAGYLYVHLVKDKKKTLKLIHRLVACQFLGEQLGKQVDHIDGNKHNNSVENLRWLTPSQNTLAFGMMQRSEAKYKKVVAVHIDGTVIEFQSRQAAAKYFGVHPAKIAYGKVYKKGSKKGWMFSLSI